MSVVIAGLWDNEEFQLLADAVEANGGTPVVCDLNRWPGEDPLAFEPGASSGVFGTEISFEEVTGAYIDSAQLFPPSDPRFLDRLQESALPTIRQLHEYRGMFESLSRTLQHHGAEVIVPLRNDGWQDRKPWQLHLYERENVPVPDTVFTNDPDRVREFYREHERVIYKPVTQGAMPRELTESDLEERLDRLSTAPVQFQEFVEGDDLRVYVLDGEVVAAVEYETDHFSFKRAIEEGESDEIAVTPVSLPDDVRDAVLRAADRAELVFTAADLRRRPDGTHLVLELNEAPRFAAPDIKADRNVAGALAEYLL